MYEPAPDGRGHPAKKGSESEMQSGKKHEELVKAFPSRWSKLGFCGELSGPWGRQIYCRPRADSSTFFK